MKNWKILVAILILVIGLGHFGGLFSFIPQDREIGRIEVSASSPYNIGCEKSYNNIQVDFCRIIKIDASTREPTHIEFCGYMDGDWNTPGKCTDSLADFEARRVYKNEQISYNSIKAHHDFTGEYWISIAGYESYGTLKGYKVYYEIMVQCDDESYNFRSLCVQPVVTQPPVTQPNITQPNIMQPPECPPEMLDLTTGVCKQPDSTTAYLLIAGLIGIIAISGWFIWSRR